MKKSILAVALLTMSAASYAQQWIMTTPELLITGAASIKEDQQVASIKFSVQETLCYSAKHFCLNPSVMWMVVENEDPTDDFSDSINIGAGLDVKYKFPKVRNNGIYVEAGPVAFVKDLGDDRVTLHVGTGVEYNRFIMSVDSYGTSDNFYMLSLGYRL